MCQCLGMVFGITLFRFKSDIALSFQRRRVAQDDGEGIRLVLASWDFIGFRVLVRKN